jgi:hypothetical protein
MNSLWAGWTNQLPWNAALSPSRGVVLKLSLPCNQSFPHPGQPRDPKVSRSGAAGAPLSFQSADPVPGSPLFWHSCFFFFLILAEKERKQWRGILHTWTQTYSVSCLAPRPCCDLGWWGTFMLFSLAHPGFRIFLIKSIPNNPWLMMLKDASVPLYARWQSQRDPLICMAVRVLLWIYKFKLGFLFAKLS